MKVDVYDFDGTIYNGDSSLDFYKFCFKKKKIIILYLIPTILSYLLYFIRIYNKTKVKETFFKFLKTIDVELFVKEFWKENDCKIKDFYKNKNHLNDIIISASPLFLLEPICKKMKVKDIIASEVDKLTGKFTSKNCKNQEKVKRLYEKYPNVKVENMYTDSYSDQPLIDISKNAYLIKGDKITKIKYYEK